MQPQLSPQYKYLKYTKQSNFTKSFVIKILIILVIIVSFYYYVHNNWRLLYDKQRVRSLDYQLFLMHKKQFTMLELQKIFYEYGLQNKKVILVLKNNGYLENMNHQQLIIKNLLAVSGDNISINNDNLLVNNVIKNKAPNWNLLNTYPQNISIKLSDDQLWLDSTAVNSIDSRYFGPVNIKDIVGIAYAIY